ncbi:MAG: DUF952 domain-containing protein [Anaerolineales bacterium]|nr:DUF952 domain-containing protein [Anaerolineales bacterium]
MLLHIISRSAWETAVSHPPYHPPSLDSEGFIHCSTVAQVLTPANERYQGQQDLLLLCIDPEKVTPPLIYEDCYETGQQFPHIYGPLDPAAVVSVVDFPPNSDGSFSLPAVLSLWRDYPILEFDGAQTAVLEPHILIKPLDGIPQKCVLCFFQDVIDTLKAEGRLRHIYSLTSEIGPNPVYEMDVDGERIVLAHPGVGAPLAAFFLDELIALGCRQFIACGGAGVIDERVGLGHVVIPTAAIRDEGSSYHYLPPAREVRGSETAVRVLQQTLARHHVPHDLGKTWTTDGIYRETAHKVALRKAEGCLTVEMETATFFAVAQFRNVTFGQLLYGGDDLTGDEWDERGWDKLTSTREKLLQLAIEACLVLPTSESLN